VKPTAGLGPGSAETQTWARSAFELLTGLPAIHRVGLAIAEGGGRQLSFTSSDRRGADWCFVDAYEDVPLNNTVRTGRPVFGSLEDLAGRYPTFVARQVSPTRALATAPVAAAGQVLGGFAVFYDAPQPFDDAQVAELRRMGEALGAALRLGQRTAALPSRSLAAERVPVGAQVATFVVPPDPAGVPAARRFTCTTLTAWGIGGDTLDTAVLCVSELVTNAIIHSHAGCEIRLALHDGVLTTSVRDGGTAMDHGTTATDDPLAVHGRGLHLIEALSTRWGSLLDAGGMTVWCELHTTAPEGAAH
jgi:anti-sigma regulatory factor (Ser/Thr protein kinase)